MRIVAGTLKSRSILAPKGDHVRPTSDKVRQAIFNVLEHAAWSPALNGAIVLDAFCGTGALGIEALSRGAAQAYFMDQDIKNVEANIASFNIADRCRVYCTNATMPPVAPRICDFVFLDPPYKKDLIIPAIIALQKNGWIGDNTIIIAESEKEWMAPNVIQEKNYGIAKATFLTSFK